MTRKKSNSIPIDVINLEYDDATIKILSMERTMMNSDMESWTTQLNFSIDEPLMLKELEEENQQSETAQMIGNLMTKTMDFLIEKDPRQILYMHIALSEKEGAEIKDSIEVKRDTDNKIGFNFQLATRRNYISKATYQQVPKVVWKKLDEEGVLAKMGKG
jgi:hypothetical protein|tara:strand:+ start:249 stop:728 length:480 start_codon:yes stop_codon:yes gene_type:complete